MEGRPGARQRLCQRGAGRAHRRVVGPVSHPRQGRGVMTVETPAFVRGPLFNAACAAPVQGRRQKMLLALLAAAADAGRRSPSTAELRQRLGVGRLELDQRLDKLERQGWLTVTWAAQGPPGGRSHPGVRNAYTLRLRP